jgi:hypothetical protein
VREVRLQWQEQPEVLGHPVTAVEIMAEKNSGGPWAFFVRQGDPAGWVSFPTTPQAISRAEEKLSNLEAAERALQLRQSIHTLIDSLPGGVLDAANQALEAISSHYGGA